MEQLLSLAFDNLSSYDGPKIRKGLRQVEGLLANICLSRAQSSRDRRASIISTRDTAEEETASSKNLEQISEDPAFCEFFKLQEGFEWNVALRLVQTLDRLLARGADGSNDLLIMSALELVQGVMLLHPPSKALFSREVYMNLLLDLLEPDFCPAIQSSTVVTLVTALIDTPRNTRTFEALDGLLTITSLFRNRCTARDVKLKLIEFLYFYLMPETPSIPAAQPNPQLPGLLQRSPSKLAKAFVGGGHGRAGSDGNGRPRSAGDGETRTQEEKQALLGRHLSSVAELVEDLKQNTPFGGVVG
ncbi:cell division control 14, SIN component [Annulohypoxylon maeteangense]|uniref:cell division control 14, SIN component n=1 Tax=Annulohypoxylon maeteangense TaxID=1927788 RepID=UPI002007C11A|nr:cell division control 14, SIN component [Annulohypoxylon maeteangense]KAI0885539.1 cell division control 14, SIN component [Annulohypoxylon maeteangense]